MPLTRRRLFASVVATLQKEKSLPKSLYLSFYGIGDARLRGNAFQLLASTELNSVVIDIKGDRGLLCYPSGIAMARDCGAQRVVTAPI